jgi:hypothetical protein
MRGTARALGALLFAASIAGPAAAQTPAVRSATISGTSVLGVRPGATLGETAEALRGCDMHMLQQAKRGRSGMTLHARCGDLSVDYVLNPDSHTVQRAEIRDGGLSTAGGVRVGDDITAAVARYGTPTVEASAGDVCAVFASQRGVSFCLRPEDARAYLERVGSKERPPLRGKIGSILVFGTAGQK